MSANLASSIPQHVAIIMDGNGRWAEKHRKPRIFGHQAGARVLGKIIQSAAEKGIRVLSVFAFSSENWQRPKEEVKALMKLFERALKEQVKKLKDNNIRIRVMGDVKRFSTSLQQLIAKAETETKENTGLTLVIAASYGGRWDIVQATKCLVEKVVAQEITIGEIDEAHFSETLALSDLPPPDLLIRTSGEERISNFFLWQLAYTELYFTDCLWPDFDEQAFWEALSVYRQRQRRYGKTHV